MCGRRQIGPGIYNTQQELKRNILSAYSWHLSIMGKYANKDYMENIARNPAFALHHKCNPVGRLKSSAYVKTNNTPKHRGLIFKIL